METTMHNMNHEQLTRLLRNWCMMNGLPTDGCAEDLLTGPNTNETQRAWLRKFCRAWDQAGERHSVEVLARFAVGIAAVDDGDGAFVVGARMDGTICVFVEGGTLPGGEAEKIFDSDRALSDAYKFALGLVSQEVDDQTGRASDDFRLADFGAVAK